jgi:pyruvate,water dikinase
MNTHDSAESKSPFIRFFGTDEAGDAPLQLDQLGGKGINLCALSTARFPVPPGFVVTVRAYREFVAANGLDAKIQQLAATIVPADPKGIEKISVQLRALFTGSPIPAGLAAEIGAAYQRLRTASGERVAVRSSATAEDLPNASFAGQQDTYLNIGGEAALLKAVQACWGSLWTARAMAYRAQQAIPLQGLGLAVVVQQMVAADAAGIMFTANPVSGVRDETVINAAWGLGEAIVGGHVTPDKVVAEKASGKIRQLAVAEKLVMTALTETGTSEQEIRDQRRNARVLNDQDVARLTELGRRVEAHYGSPQDCEWAIKNGQLFLLQARPITALPEDPALVERIRQREIERLRKLAGDKRRVWVRHNLDEILAAPTPLTWDIIRNFMSGAGGFGRMYQDLGYTPSREVCETGFLELIGGTIYADPERAAKLFWPVMPLEYDLDAVAKNPKLMDAAPGKFAPDKADGRFLVMLPGILLRMLRCSRQMKRLSRAAADRFDKEVLPPFLDWLRTKRSQDLRALATADLLTELRERIERGLHEIGRESLKPGFFGGTAQADLESRLAQLMDPAESRRLTLALTQALEGDTTVEQNAALYELARGRSTRQEFLEKFGHRAVSEMELANPRWREDDAYVRQLLGTYLADNVEAPAARHAANVAKRKETEAALPAVLKEWGGSSFLEEITELMRAAQQLLPYREIGKNYLIMGYETIRLALLELGRRWNLGADIFFLRLDELKQFEERRNELTAAIPQRKLEWQAARRLERADVVDSQALDRLGLPQEYAAAAELRGDPVAAGVATGNALIVFNPQEAASDCTDYILVCPSTDPAWTALFVHARGLVVEQGGVLSHGAIVARDFGIPAVVCPGATRRIPKGARLRVDGNRGIINLL